MPTPPTIRILAIAPGFLKSLATAATGTVLVADPGANFDRNIPAIRFSSNQANKKQFVSVWLRPSGGGSISDEFLVFGKQYPVGAKSPIEVGPILLPPGFEVAAAITTEPSDAANDDKVNYQPNVWQSDFS
jgi:hypothetical protein